MENKKKIVIGIAATLLLVILGGVAVFTGMKMFQTKEVPIAPTVPQKKPKAAAPTPACSTSFTVLAAPRAIDCQSITISPNVTSVSSPREVKNLTVSSTGGTGNITYSWALTSSGSDKGSLSATTGTTVNWTAPASMPSGSQTWTIAATARDANDNTDSTGCIVTLNFSTSPTHKECRNNACATVSGSGTDNCSSDRDCHACDYRCSANNDCANGLVCDGGKCRTLACPDKNDCNCTTTPVTPTTVSPTHKECRNNACTTVSGSGSNACSSDVDCKPKATPPAIPKSGTSLPTVITVIGGAMLLILGAFGL